MSIEEPEKLADELDRAADQMQRRSQELGKEAEAVRGDWESKRSDPGVPGAPAPESEDEPPSEVGPPGQGPSD